MPKRKDALSDEEASIDFLTLGHKRHKKHKHKKRRRRKGEEGEDGSGDGSPGTPSESFKHGLKLKIKIGGQTFGETRVSKTEVNEVESDESGNIDVVDAAPSLSSLSDSMNQGSFKKVKKVDDDDAWLEALEEGRLEEVDEELRRMKDPNLMTARQRSMIERKAQKEKEDVSPVVTETKVLSEEMIQQRLIQAKKRKKLAEEKKEKDKKQTIERLLKKPDAKPKSSKKIVKKADVPKMKYIDSKITERSLSLPVGFNYPLKAQVAKEPPLPVMCGVKGCPNQKKYSCSKSGVPLCSLECYKKNMLLFASKSTIQVS